jgi:hypothetical protein
VSCVATGGREREGKQANKAELSVVDGARRLLPLCRLNTSDAVAPVRMKAMGLSEGRLR